MTHISQKQRILDTLTALRDGTLDIPEEFIRRHPTGDGISGRYFKQVLLISECNGRISELRTKGHEIETSTVKDRYGFAYHRLKPTGITRADHLRVAKDAIEDFDNYQSTTSV